MAKRELSSNLKSLKFMQRAVQKQEKTNSKQELKPDGAFVSATMQSRKWYSLMSVWFHRRAQLRNCNVI